MIWVLGSPVHAFFLLASLAPLPPFPNVLTACLLGGERRPHRGRLHQPSERAAAQPVFQGPPLPWQGCPTARRAHPLLVLSPIRAASSLPCSSVTAAPGIVRAPVWLQVVAPLQSRTCRRGAQPAMTHTQVSCRDLAACPTSPQSLLLTQYLQTPVLPGLPRKGPLWA